VSTAEAGAEVRKNKKKTEPMKVISPEMMSFQSPGTAGYAAR